MSAAGGSDRAGSWTPVRCNQRTMAVKRICSAWQGALDSKTYSSLQVDAQGGIRPLGCSVRPLRIEATTCAGENTIHLVEK